MKSVRGMLVVVAALGMTAMLAGPVGAVEFPPSVNTLTIKKVVVGPVSASTTFTVHVHCEPTQGKASSINEDVVFDSTGTATSGNEQIETSDFFACTATETVTGGAQTVAFACSPTDDADIDCSTTATSGTLEFMDVIDTTGTITVTNTFPVPVTPVTPVTPIQPAAEVVVAPAFTG